MSDLNKQEILNRLKENSHLSDVEFNVLQSHSQHGKQKKGVYHPGGKNILVTGGAGFIGSNFIRYYLKNNPRDVIINLDLLTYAGNLDNLLDVDEHYGAGVSAGAKRYYFVKGDIRDPEIVNKVISKADMVVHFAAESHVDRSITDPDAFLTTNVQGTQVLLEAAREHKIDRFVHISTDEVYGTIEEGHYREVDRLTPRSPYSASKAASDLLALSYFITFQLPVVVTRTSNNYGPYQHPEKFIPLFVTNFIEGKKVPLYGYGLNRRDWIYVEDNCRAIETILKNGELGEIYNIGTHENELANIEMASLMAYILKVAPHSIEFVQDRAGHDFRYGIDMQKVRDLGWEHEHDLKSGLKKTVEWYKENEWWWKKVKGDDYEEYIKKHYK